jgi:hypothetical protein
MPGPTSRPALVLALALLPCACASSSSTPHLRTVTLTVADAGIQPGPDVTIPRFATVVFRHGLSDRDATFEVSVDRPLEPSEPCSTTLNFLATGARSQSAPIGARDIASLCFHDAGVFPYVIRAGAREMRGTVRVGGAP